MLNNKIDYLEEKIKDLQNRIKETENELELSKLFINTFNLEDIEDFNIFSNMNFITIKTENPIEVVKNLQKHKAKFYVKNRRLTNGYSLEKKYGYREIAPIKIDVRGGNFPETIFKFAINFNKEPYWVWIKINTSKLIVNAQRLYDKSMYSETYENCELISKISHINGYTVQEYATHADGLYQYTIWFNNKDLEPTDVLKELLEK